MKLLVVLLLCTVFLGTAEGQSSQRSGSPVDKASRYLIYLPGRIVQEGNTRPTSPRFGVYEYEQILETFKQSGFKVISEARDQSTDVEPILQVAQHLIVEIDDGDFVGFFSRQMMDGRAADLSGTQNDYIHSDSRLA